MPRYTEHEPQERPNWDTKVVCSCGERCSHWMEFYRHRGDAYLAALRHAADLEREVDELRGRVAEAEHAIVLCVDNDCKWCPTLWERLYGAAVDQTGAE